MFPVLFSFCSHVPSFIFLLFPCSQFISFCSHVPSFIFLLFPCSQFISFCSHVPSFIFLLFPCSQFYFPFVPVFPVLFSFCSRVPSFIFLLFPCSQFYFPFVPVFPVLFSFCSRVPSFIFLLFPCSQFYFPFVPVFPVLFSFCSRVPWNPGRASNRSIGLSARFRLNTNLLPTREATTGLLIHSFSAMNALGVLCCDDITSERVLFVAEPAMVEPTVTTSLSWSETQLRWRLMHELLNLLLW